MPAVPPAGPPESGIGAEVRAAREALDRAAANVRGARISAVLPVIRKQRVGELARELVYCGSHSVSWTPSWRHTFGLPLLAFRVGGG